MDKVANLIDGRRLARLMETRVKERVLFFKTKGLKSPGLGVILVGDNPASRAYVSRKEKVAERVGFSSFEAHLPAKAKHGDVEKIINDFNNDDSIDGILLQLPLPSHLNAGALIELIDPQKDSDGLHIINQGKLLRGESGCRPCTPLGILKLIDLALSGIKIDEVTSLSETEIPPASLAGLKAAVIGRSILVGKPVSLMLQERNATVTMIHSKTKDPHLAAGVCDIVVAAAGVPGLVKKSWIKPGAVVIDVGINRTKSGRLTGDVDFEEVSRVASQITPVPGGVGPMTVAMLMQNTLENFERSLVV